MKIPTVPERPAELPALEERRTTLRDERLEIEAELAKLQTASWNEGQMNVVALNMAASRLAAGEEVPASRDVEALCKRIELVSTAERQVRAKISELRDQHAELTARAFRPAHKQAVARIAKALTELVRANEAEIELRARVPGIRLRPADFPNVGGFGPRGDPCQVWKNYVLNAGLLEDAGAWPSAAL